MIVNFYIKIDTFQYDRFYVPRAGVFYVTLLIHFRDFNRINPKTNFATSSKMRTPDGQEV